jgi:3-deoxy-7-phosphoheptulonate synthase
MFRTPYELASRLCRPEGSTVLLGDTEVGGRELVVIARVIGRATDELSATMAELRELDVHIVCRHAAPEWDAQPPAPGGMRGDLPRLHTAAASAGIKVVAEVTHPAALDRASGYADAYEVRGRNMQNFVLLRELGRCRTPVLLNRAMSATVEEWLLAALCECGIRTFDSSCDTLDLASVAVIKDVSHLPVVVDPAEAVQHVRHMAAMARAAIAVGADGVVLPIAAQTRACDELPPRSLQCEELRRIVTEVTAVARATGRQLAACVVADSAGAGRAVPAS